MSELAQIDKRLVTPYHPRANGLAERTVQTSTTIIKKLLEGEHSKWSSYLPVTQLAINIKISPLHDSSPFALMFGRRFAGLRDFTQAEAQAMSEKQIMDHMQWMNQIIYPHVAEKVRARQEVGVEKFAQSHHIKDSRLRPGTMVMALDPTRASKLDPRYEGPYKILRCNRGGAYEIQDMTGETLKRRFPPGALKQVSNKLAEQDPVYEVQAILEHRGPAHAREYLVRWKGYTNAHDSWEPSSHFEQQRIIADYWDRRMPLRQSTRGRRHPTLR